MFILSVLRCLTHRTFLGVWSILSPGHVTTSQSSSQNTKMWRPCGERRGHQNGDCNVRKNVIVMFEHENCQAKTIWQFDCRFLPVNLFTIKHICIAYFSAKAKMCVLATSACKHISQRRYIAERMFRAWEWRNLCTISLPWLIIWKSLGMELWSLHLCVSEVLSVLVGMQVLWFSGGQ